jgi:hypothetical protein
MEGLMHTATRASRILNLLSGTDALRKLRADNQLYVARRAPACGYGGSAMAEATAGGCSEHWSSFRDDGLVEVEPRSPVIHVAVTMNFRPVSDA